MDDAAVRDATTATYRDLVAAGHDVDCFLVADPRALDAFTGDPTRLCVVDHGFRADRWEHRPRVVTAAAEALMVRAAGRRLRAMVGRANRRVEYDAFVHPRWTT
jgi:hypothetical protein